MKQAYEKVEWETTVEREENKTYKKISKPNKYFEQSLQRIAAAGYERHPSIVEIVSLMIDGLEGKLTAPHLQETFNDMKYHWMEENDNAEMTNTVLGYKEIHEGSYDHKLVFYENPKQFNFWEKNKNIVVVRDPYNQGRKLNFNGKQEFELEYLVKDLKHQYRQNIPLSEVVHYNEDFVEFICGRPINEMPKYMLHAIYLSLPYETVDEGIGEEVNVVTVKLTTGRPAGEQINIDASGRDRLNASRGVKEVQ